MILSGARKYQQSCSRSYIARFKECVIAQHSLCTLLAHDTARGRSGSAPHYPLGLGVVVRATGSAYCSYYRSLILLFFCFLVPNAWQQEYPWAAGVQQLVSLLAVASQYTTCFVRITRDAPSCLLVHMSCMPQECCTAVTQASSSTYHHALLYVTHAEHDIASYYARAQPATDRRRGGGSSISSQVQEAVAATKQWYFEVVVVVATSSYYQLGSGTIVREQPMVISYDQCQAVGTNTYWAAMEQRRLQQQTTANTEYSGGVVFMYFLRSELICRFFLASIKQEP